MKTTANTGLAILSTVGGDTNAFEVRATCDGKRFDFVSFRQGAFEVYDYPRSWKGLPRFVGYMSPDQGIKLRNVLQRGCIGY